MNNISGYPRVYPTIPCFVFIGIFAKTAQMRFGVPPANPCFVLKEIWKTRGGIYKANARNYFKYKWSGTWQTEPEITGWIKNWPKDFVDNPPNMSKSKVKTLFRYVYFEKDIEDKEKKAYLLKDV